MSASRFTDRTGRNIAVGDIIAYTTSSEGAGMISTGVVTRFSDKSLWAKDVDPKTYQVVIVEDVRYDDDLSQPPYHTGYNGKPYYHQIRTVLGKKEINENIISNPSPYRFLILN